MFLCFGRTDGQKPCRYTETETRHQLAWWINKETDDISKFPQYSILLPECFPGSVVINRIIKSVALLATEAKPLFDKSVDEETYDKDNQETNGDATNDLPGLGAANDGVG